MLKIKDLCSGYGGSKVLFGINIEVPAKQITVVVGPNGAGKTTLLNSVTGLATIHSGEIVYKGENITGIPSYRLAKMGISYVPQRENIFSSLSVRENLVMAGYLMSKTEREGKMKEIFELFPVLKDFIDRKAGTLSGGERRMLAIAMGLMRSPELLLLDEITTDLAPIMVKRVLKKLIELKDKLGITLLMVEQAARRALEVADKAYLLVSGQIKFEGKGVELLYHPEFTKKYLGVV
jgi:branched-chain amino acid transport system ATP-binding protein